MCSHPSGATWRIAGELSQALGVTLQAHGVGAGSTERVEGHGSGEADYASPCGGLHVEITGPLRPGVPAHAALWLRPDKLAAAERAAAAGALTVVAHETPMRDGAPLVRYVVLDGAVLQLWREGGYRTVIRSPRGAEETYVEIPARDACVQSLAVALPVMLAALGKSPSSVQQLATVTRPAPPPFRIYRPGRGFLLAA